MSPLTTVGRGLRSRVGSTAMILLVAVVAVAAATAGPTYYSAAQTSILRDTVSQGPVLGRGLEVVQSGGISGLLDPLQASVNAALSDEAHLFQPPIDAIEATAFDPHTKESMGIDWRTGVCAQLHIQGACPAASNQVIISQSLAGLEQWRVGQRVVLPTWGTITITGIYAVPNGSADYWFARSNLYFPYETPTIPGSRVSSPTTLDAMFTVEATLLDAPANEQGSVVVDDVLDLQRLRASDTTPLANTVAGLVGSQELSAEQAVVTSEIPNTMSTVHQGWSSLAVPVLIISVQLTALSWLLLLLLVSESAAARGAEVALARLRGRGSWRTLGFGLSEPVALLAIALPAGAFGGWGATLLLGRAKLRPGTPVGMPGLAWAAAAVAAAGGVAAVVLASRRTLRRPVVEQWRRASRRANDRSWVTDAVLLTGAAAGLLELWLSGSITSAHHSALSLLVPGLLGLSVAVVASRLLPLACRAVMAAPRRGKNMAAFLALRHIARRPGGARTTIMLATSFALATFGVAAFGVDQVNYRSVADATVGAPTVVTVTIPSGTSLAGVVHRADPSGRLATPVEFVSNSGVATLGVDPATWTRIASWPTGTPAGALRRLAAQLDPPAPPPIVLNGDAARVLLHVTRIGPGPMELTMDVITTDGSGPTPVPLGVLAGDGTVTATGSLVSCPCQVQDFSLATSGVATGPQKGSIQLQSLQVHDATGWHPAGANFGDANRWASAGDQLTPALLSASGQGLGWTFDVGAGGATLTSVNRPDPLPAVVTTSVSRQEGPLNVTGLDGQPLPVQVLGTLPSVPSAPNGAILIDQNYAEVAAANDLSLDIQQVWLAKGAAPTVLPRLTAEGVAITATQTQSAEMATLNRQGPGLARILFLAEAAAAALLAAGGAVLGLYLLARRRRFELAALVASGVRRRTLLASVAAEQLIVVAFGIIVGIATGLAATAAALGDIPEFQNSPGAARLISFPPIAPLVVILAVSVVVVVGAALWGSISLVRSVKLDQLREAPS